MRRNRENPARKKSTFSLLFYGPSLWTLGHKRRRDLLRSLRCRMRAICRGSRYSVLHSVACRPLKPKLLGDPSSRARTKLSLPFRGRFWILYSRTFAEPGWLVLQGTCFASNSGSLQRTLSLVRSCVWRPGRFVRRVVEGKYCTPTSAECGTSGGFHASTLHRGRIAVTSCRLALRRGRVGLGPKVVAQRRGRIRFLENFRNFGKINFVASLSRKFRRQGRRFALNNRRVASRRVGNFTRRRVLLDTRMRNMWRAWRRLDFLDKNRCSFFGRLFGRLWPLRQSWKLFSWQVLGDRWAFFSVIFFGIKKYYKYSVCCCALPFQRRFRLFKFQTTKRRILIFLCRLIN